MAITFDASSASAMASDTTSVSFSHTIGSGSSRLLVVATAMEAVPNIAVSSVTYNGTPLTLATTSNTAEAFNETVELWYMLHSSLPTAGTYTITVTWASTFTGGSASAISFAGAAQSAPEATNTSASNVDGTVHTTSLTTLSNNAVVVMAVAGGASGTWTPDSGQTEVADLTGGSGGNCFAFGYELITTASAQSWQWTNSGTQTRFAGLAASFAELSTVASCSFDDPALSFDAAEDFNCSGVAAGCLFDDPSIPFDGTEAFDCAPTAPGNCLFDDPALSFDATELFDCTPVITPEPPVISIPAPPGGGARFPALSPRGPILTPEDDRLIRARRDDEELLLPALL